VEVHVDDGRQLTASQGAGEVAQRVRRRHRAERASRGKLDDGRCRERCPALSSRQVRRAAGSERAVDVAELAQASATSTSVYQPPPQKSVGFKPCSRILPSSSTRAPSRRLWAGGRGPSSACGARAGHVKPHPWPVGPTRARPLLPRHQQAERAPLWRSHPVVPPAARRSAPTPRRREVAQRGRTRPRTVPATWRPSSEKYRRPPR
jgi:hypothetical protein